MAVVKQVVTNINGEVTAIVAMKGNREIVKRSATSVIKLFAVFSRWRAVIKLVNTCFNFVIAHNNNE